MKELLETVEKLAESLQRAISILKEILDCIIKGNYTQEQASIDYENILFDDDIDYMARLEDYIYSDETLPPPQP